METRDEGKSLSESEFERDPTAVAGRALLEACLARLTEAQRKAFWAAVERSFAGPPPEA